MQFTSTHIVKLRVERIQIPETFIDKIEDLGIQFKCFLVILDEAQYGTSKEVSEKFSEVGIFVFLHSSHVIEL